MIIAAVIAAVLSVSQQAAIDAAVENARVESHVQAISIAVARDGGILYTRGYGTADSARQIAAQSKTVYAIGSITKQFTATLVMQLVERGEVGLDDPVGRYLPAAPHASEITIRELLEQRSGLPDYLGDPFMLVQYAHSTSVTPADLLADVAKQPLHFTPGSAWEYSNSNYIVLGMLIEKITGHAYAQELRDKLLVPLHLNATTFEAPAPGPQAAVGMTWDATAKRSNPQERWSAQIAYAAGALNSNVEDLVAWDAAFFKNQVVSATSVATMTTPAALPGGGSGDYGFGWVVSTMYGHRRVWHNGGIPGFSAQNNVFPDDHLQIVMLANDVTFDGSLLMKKLLDISGVVTADERNADEHPEPVAGEKPEITALAREQFEAFHAGHLHASRFTDQMKAALTPALVSQVQSGLTPLGTIRSMTLVGHAAIRGIDLYTYQLDCEHGAVHELIGIDSTGRIAGLYFKP